MVFCTGRGLDADLVRADGLSLPLGDGSADFVLALDVIEPHVREWDEAQAFPDEVMQQIGELGFLGVIFPEAYGGGGLSYADYAVANAQFCFPIPGDDADIQAAPVQNRVAGRVG